MSDIPRPELLAPVGGHLQLRAAVANGADAVYLGMHALNARAGAENFSADELREACGYAHLRDVRVYLTANVLVLPDEMDDALSLVDTAWAAGVDAVIVQDLGLARLVREQLPHVRLHASTQIGAHSVQTVGALAELGFERVTLAREMHAREIEAVVAAASMEIEVFAHGALCVCYSGQCLLSSMVGGRSANRGRCAQPCRLPYSLRDAGGGTIETSGEYLLSPRDLCSLSVLPQLLRTGVHSLKIEGRMKSPEYVAVVTGVYRAAIDRAAENPDDFEVRMGEVAALEEVFSRGFTTGYLAGEHGAGLMGTRRPNNRGVLVGRVSDMRPGEALVTLDCELDEGDTLEFWTARGRFAQRAGELKVGEVRRSVVPAGERVWLSVEESVGAGDRVFRVVNARLQDAARRTFSDPHAPGIPLDFAVEVVLGRPVTVTVTDAKGRVGRASGDVAEPARTKAVTADEVSEHVAGRLGGTPFECRSFTLELSPGIGVGFSALHRVRRDALEDYLRVAHGESRPMVGVHPRALTPRHAAASPPEIVAMCDSLDVARACLDAGAHRVCVPAGMKTSGASVDVDPRYTWLLDRILHTEELSAGLSRVGAGDHVCAGTLGGLHGAHGSGAFAEAHWGLGAMNQWTVSALQDLGASAVWLSPELNVSQICTVAKVTSPALGVLIAGVQEVMVTEACILSAEGPCGRACADCARRASAKTLVDRKGYAFPVRVDAWGRSHIFNAVPLDGSSAVPDLLESGVGMLGVAAVGLDAGTATTHVRRAVEALAVASRGGRPVASPGTTAGHLYRGVGDAGGSTARTTSPRRSSSQTRSVRGRP